ncbi:MAG: DUF6323 family protein [Eubacteriales bacterium]|nr:DUF6323 family protein [Eubacteriales bacterium]
MEKNWLDLVQGKNQLAKVIDMNQYTERYGLALSEEQAELILENRKKALNEQRRVEFGEGIAHKIIMEFCDSDYINQDNYVETGIRLQEIFYLYKNEMQDEITDDELLHLMRNQYEQLCYGDLDYLEGTCLSDFAQAIRAGYSGYQDIGNYSKYDGRDQWNYELYMEKLRDLG